jgi:hypothetical protein
MKDDGGGNRFLKNKQRAFHLIWTVHFVLIIAVTIMLYGCAEFEKLKPVSKDELNRVSGSFPRAETCGGCHVDIYNEWLKSPHANAYLNETYRIATSDYSFDSCLGCHAPEPRYTEQQPAVRDSFREEGVTCVTCHLEEGKLSGPIDRTGVVAPHPVSVADRFHDAKLCGRCHEGTYKEWKSIETNQKQTCQECHMPEVTRRITQSTDLASKVIVSFEDNVLQKKHSFLPVPTEMKTPAFSSTCQKEAGTALIRIHNHLPHSLPTGDFGVRVVALEALSRNRNKQSVLLAKRELTRRLSTAIPAGQSLSWKIPIPDDCLRIDLRLVRLRCGDQGPVQLFHQGFPHQ